MADFSTAQQNDIKQFDAARGNANQNIFNGVLGQSRNVTISYKIKDGVDLTEFAALLTQYAKDNDSLAAFESIQYADFPAWDRTTDYGFRSGNAQAAAGIGGNGQFAPKEIANSYHASYIDIVDTDKDGLFDFIERQFGTDLYDPDTDKDGVPDGQEVLDDQTLAVDKKDLETGEVIDPGSAIKSYKAPEPSTETTAVSAAADNTVSGAAPKVLYDDPTSTNTPADKLLAQQGAGDVIVRAYAYVPAEGDKEVTYDSTKQYAEVKIPYADLLSGKFSLSIPANSIDDSVNQIVLVAFPPDGAEAQATLGSVITVNRDSEQSDADTYEPVGQDVTAGVGSTPSAESGVSNTSDLPEGTSYEWKETPDISVPGDKDATVVVTYPDGSTDEVEVTVKVTDNRTPVTPSFDPEGTDSEGNPFVANPSADDPAQCTVAPYVTVPTQEGITYTVTNSKGETITPDANGHYVYAYGETVKVTVVANDGFVLSKDAPSEWTFSSPKAASCVPAWEDDKVLPGDSVAILNTGDEVSEGTTVEVEGPGKAVLNPDGSIMVTPNGDAKPGDKITVTVKNQDGKVIDSFTVTVGEGEKAAADKKPSKKTKLAKTGAAAGMTAVVAAGLAGLGGVLVRRRRAEED